MIMTPEKWQRYIDNQCTEKERMEILAYLKDLAPGALERELDKGFQEDAPTMPVDVAKRMDNYLAAFIQPANTRKLKNQHYWYYWAAACVLGLIIGVGAFMRQAANQADPALAYQTYPNTSLNVQEITLPDSSHVWLTPHSVLELATDYAKGKRTIKLEGEAYFEVAHDPTRPFIINAGSTQTIVLGTHFNIEAWHKESETRVSLTQGKVAVKIALNNGQDNTQFLSPGNRLIYQSDKQQAYTEPIGSVNESGWKNGDIVLNDLTVADVFKRLEKRFGTTISYSPELFKEKRFTANYRNADLSLILKNIAFVEGFRYKIATDTVFILSSK